MTLAAAKLVDWDLLGEAVAASFAIGIGVLLVAGIAVVASLRAQDQRTAGGGEGGVVGWSALTVLCVLAIAGAIAAGIWVMAQ
jgi:hypothetical protein